MNTDRFEILKTLVKMVCVGDEILIIDRNGNWSKQKVTLITNDYISLNGIRRLNYYRISTCDGWDLFGDELVYHI